MISNFTSSSNK